MDLNSYLEKHSQYRDGLILLHELISSEGLKQTIKWSAPVYTWQNKNVIGLGAFKSYFGIWFFQGALLDDYAQVLVNAQEGKTKALRQWRFESIDQIDPELVRDYVKQALANQKAGKEINPEKKPLVVPDELKEAMATDPELETAFNGLSLTYKREYAGHISDAKKAETREKRLAKVIPMIKNGIGLNDKYRNC